MIAKFVLQRGNIAGISNATEEKAAGTMLSERENKTFVSRGKKKLLLIDPIDCLLLLSFYDSLLKGVEVKPRSIAEGSIEKSQDDSPSATAVNLHKEPTLQEENCEKVTGDAIFKDDIESSVEDRQLSVLMFSEGINVQPCYEDMRLSLMKASG